MLPRSVSWPILNSFVSSPDDSLEWKGACFYKNRDWMEFHNKSRIEFGGGTLHVKPESRLPVLPRSVSWPILNSLVSSPDDSLEWKGACFYKNRAWMEFHNKSRIEFGGGTLHVKPESRLPVLPRSVSWPILNSLVSSPDDSLEWKGACFYKNRAWMEFHNKSRIEFGGGTLHVKGQDILPWNEWLFTKDDSSAHIALLPSHPDLQAKFNETAAWEYALSMSSQPFGFHNLIFSWIDTIDGNHPPLLDSYVMAFGVDMWIFYFCVQRTIYTFV
ncbi:uncharacterized protein LOC114295209 [Camellia sinensis]|uniref:uncharacterized protein LOC114295209 n=1 Tax=Camellia sinensis TaxID=4442 RepID=UPI00103626B9|nr:uncharacterized protein LOC114295209 [Camellia sinensis]